ncbi:MAG TPA: NAD-dependent epimerase/dehydratase family protein, partial [Ramlibacter sp.]
MRVLLTGASGFIGRAVADALLRNGHSVVRVLRRPPADGGDVVRADFAAVPGRAWWQSRLEGIDAVVNTVGIIREQPGQGFQALHTDAPAELF